MGKSIPPGLEPIPHPPTLPLVGNVLAIDPENPMASIVGMMKQYGPIITLKFPKQTIIAVGSQEYVQELCDQERFIKNVSGALEEVRAIAKDGKHHLAHHCES
jgi:cytochrome P450/NADPH-cytochrome P450 reductase